MKMQKMTGCPCQNPTPVQVQQEVEQQNMLAMIMVQRQEYSTIYPPCEALQNGTVFPCLNKPYTKKKR